MDSASFNIQQLVDDEIFGELRRRNLPPYMIRQQLNLGAEPSGELIRTRSWGERTLALFFIALITVMLVTVIGVLSIQEKEIPDLLSGLAGSGLGAIAGILAGGKQAVGGTVPIAQAEPGEPTSE